MILLAIDTATECCSAALWCDGKLYHRSTLQPRLHAEFILPFIDEILGQAAVKKSEIEGIIVGQGPGAFTGVRIGVGIAQGLALALNIPIVSVSNLETLAFSAYQALQTREEKNILVATDARMNEVYYAKYKIKGNKMCHVIPESVGAASDVDLKNIDAYIGSGFSVYPELKDFAKNTPMLFETKVYSQAKDMLLMVKNTFRKHQTPIESIRPVYLREP